MPPSPSSEGETDSQPQIDVKNKMVFAVDETPTPSRYIRHQYGCEDLFEEVCTGLNPFDEQFRRASQARQHSQINLESSTPHIMAVSPRLGNIDASSSSYQSDLRPRSDVKDVCNESKMRNGRDAPSASDDESLDTPRIIPPTPVDSDHTISSTSRDDLCHRFQQRQCGYESLALRDSSAGGEEGGDRRDCICNQSPCAAHPHGREQSNQYCVSSSQLCLPQKPAPFRSLSELSAKMSCSDVTTVTDDEADETSGQKRNSEDDDEDEICVDDNGEDVVEFESRATKRRRTLSGCIEVNDVNASGRKRHQTSCQDARYGHDDLQVVSDISMNESDEGYASVRYPPSCPEEGASGYQLSSVVEDSANSKEIEAGSSIRCGRRTSGSRSGLGSRQKLSINVTSAAEVGRSTSSVISTPTPVITAGPSLTQCLRNSPIIEDRSSAPSGNHTPSSPHQPLQASLSHHANPNTFPSSDALPCMSGSVSSEGVTPATVITGPALPPASPSATVLQLFLRLPNGQAIPVEIPATPLVSNPSTPVPLSSAYGHPKQQQRAEQLPSASNKQSLAKMRLKAALTGSQSAARPATRPPPSRALTAHRIASLTRPPEPSDGAASRVPNYHISSVTPSGTLNSNTASPNHESISGVSSTNLNQSPTTLQNTQNICDILSSNHNALPLSNNPNPVAVPSECSSAISVQPLTNHVSALQSACSNVPIDHSVNGYSATHQSGVAPATSICRGLAGSTNNCPIRTQRGKKRSLAPEPKDEDEEKRMKFLERNRAAAVRCREKKKEWVKRLASKSTELATVNTRLQSEVASLRAEVATLKALLLQHKTCPVFLANIRGVNPDEAVGVSEGAQSAVPSSAEAGLKCDTESHSKPRSRSMSLPTLQPASVTYSQNPSQIQGLNSVNCTPITTVTVAQSDSSSGVTVQKGESGTSHREVSQNIPDNLTKATNIARRTVLTVPTVAASGMPGGDTRISVPATVAVLAPSRSDAPAAVAISTAAHPALPTVTHFPDVPVTLPPPPTLIQTAAVHPHLYPGALQPQQHHSAVLSLHQPVAISTVITQQPGIVALPNFSQAPLYSTSAPTFVTVPQAAQVPLVFPHHHIQRLPAPMLQQPQAIAPAPAKMITKCNRPPSSKEHFTLTSLAASLQFVQSSLTSSSRILASLGTSDLNEIAAARAAVASVPGFSSANLAVESKAVVLDGAATQLLLPSASGQPMPALASYVQGPVLSAQHIQHTTLTQHLSVPLTCVDDAPSTAAIIEDIAEIEESSSKIVSMPSYQSADAKNAAKSRSSPPLNLHGVANTVKPNYSPTSHCPFTDTSVDASPLRNSDSRSNLVAPVVASRARDSGSSSFLTIPTIIVSDETANRSETVDVCRSLAESYHGSVNSAPFHTVASSASLQPSLISSISGTSNLYSLSPVHDNRLRAKTSVLHNDRNLQIVDTPNDNPSATFVSEGNTFTASCS